MTLQESAQAKAIWTARVVATSVIFGGFVGGAVLGIGMPLIALATQWPPQVDATWLVQIPFFTLVAALYGIAIGLPSSVLTGVAYLAGRDTLRRRWRLTAFGVVASAIWGAALADLMSSLPATLEICAMMAATFAACGAAATLACFWLLERWGLHKPG